MSTDASEYYAASGPMTHLPADVPVVANDVSFVQNLFVHMFWAPQYGASKVADERQTRAAAAMLDAVQKIDERPLTAAREPAQRAGVVCRHFSTLGVALRQRARVPARARCGFATYFEPGKYIDHWIVEEHDGTRWVQRDFQLDDLQRNAINAQFDPDDLPPGAFLTGGEAWQLIRKGDADPELFGILEYWGRWFVYANLVRDLAALNKVEMLPWDAWGSMPGPDGAIDNAFADELAETCASDDLALVQRAYADDRVRMAGRVITFTEKGPREESVEAGAS